MRSILVSLLLVALTAPVAADASPTWIRDFGTFGSGPGAVSGSATYVDTDAAGNVYVADRGVGKVHKYTATGTYVLSFGSPGSGVGQLGTPFGLAVDGSGFVYVTDLVNGRVNVFTSAGVYVTRWGSTGSGTGQLQNPEGVAVSAAGVVYVSDTNNHRVQMFQTDGTYIGQWGSNGSGPGQLAAPTGICIAPGGDVLVADHNNHRIQRFSSAGAWIGGFGVSGINPGEFGSIWDIDTDAAGNVWVTDVSPVIRVQKFTPAGVRLALIGSDAYLLQACGPLYLYSPYGVAVRGPTIYVVDSNGCFRVAQYEDAAATPTLPASWGHLKARYRP